MRALNLKQTDMLSAEYLFDINPLHKYQLLFKHLDSTPLNTTPEAARGRKPIPKSSLLKALIYKNLKALPTLSDLVTDLKDNPSIALKCGFHPKQIPSVERFSTFLRDTDNQILQTIRKSLALELVESACITGRFLSIDSCPIPANVKENNLKCSVTNRFDKNKVPKGDPDARLGVIIHFPKPFKKEIQFFWGYRNHTVCDALSELPVIEITKPANVAESKLFVPLFTQIRDEFDFAPEGILGDAIYDAEYILEFVLDDLHSQPCIARNPRWEARRQVTRSPKGGLICVAGFEMIYWGKFKDRGRIRRKFVCPITHSKKFAKEHPTCPWNHPTFLHGKGCVSYLRGDRNLRAAIDYGSQNFKKIYHLRTGSERIFSRLLTLCMQNPSVIGLKATANHCTIAHITVLLVAVTADKTGNHDKIRFIKTFLPNL